MVNENNMDFYRFVDVEIASCFRASRRIARKYRYFFITLGQVLFFCLFFFFCFRQIRSLNLPWYETAAARVSAVSAHRVRARRLISASSFAFRLRKHRCPRSRDFYPAIGFCLRTSEPKAMLAIRENTSRQGMRSNELRTSKRSFPKVCVRRRCDNSFFSSISLSFAYAYFTITILHSCIYVCVACKHKTAKSVLMFSLLKRKKENCFALKREIPRKTANEHYTVKSFKFELTHQNDVLYSQQNENVILLEKQFLRNFTQQFLVSNGSVL